MAAPLPKIFKKNPYRNYEKVKEHIPAILRRLINTKRGDIQNLSNETGIPYSTLSRWHHALCKNTRFNPLEKKWGQHHRIFSDAEEDAIADYIVENFIIPGYHFTDADFRDIAMQAYREKYYTFLNSDDPEERKKAKNFNCSDGFIADFKYHHGFSSKCFHAKRRNASNVVVEERFLKEMENLFKTVKKEYILNADETGWKLFPNGLLTWGEKGKDNVSRQSIINDKAQITVLATVSAASTKFPLLFIAQGKTDAVEASQIGDVGFHWTTHSDTGWMTEEVFIYYLKKVREFVNHNETLHLIIDLYPAHMTDEVKKLANELNFKFYIIPAGMTDHYQPLDRYIFGALKAKARRLFRLRNEAGSALHGTKQEACQDMVAAWESVTAHVINLSWSIYIEDHDVSPERVHNEILIRHHREKVAQLRKESIQKRLESRSKNDDDFEYKAFEF